MSSWMRFDGPDSEWDAALLELPNSNFYQCHAWGEVKRRLGWEVLRIACPSPAAAMAQVLLRRYPLGLVVAWIPGGVAGAPGEWARALPTSIRSLAEARFLYSRMNALYETSQFAVRCLADAGWRRPTSRFGSGLSLAYDLSRPEAARLAAASGNWRHNLKRSGRHGLRIARWSAPAVAAMSAIYRSLEAYKSLSAQVSDDELASYVALLGERLILLRCDDGTGAPIALRACGIFGDTAWDLLAAATPAARKVYASHATLWRLLDECTARGVARYDMGGADAAGNKGVYDFKRGIGSVDFEYLGEWEWCTGPMLRMAANAALARRGARL